MTNHYRATPEQWEFIERYADGRDPYSCFLELRARIEALEAAQQPHQDKMDRLIAIDRGDPGNITPEHSARDMKNDLHPEVKAAYAYVHRVLHTADIGVGGIYCWHGWAIREAFLAGCSHAAALAQPEPVAPTDEEIMELMPETMRAEFSFSAKICSDATGAQVKPGLFRVVLNTAAVEYARAVLARYGTPAIAAELEGQ